MQPEMWIVVAVILGTFAVIATGRVRSELAALAGCCVLVLTRVLSTGELFPALSSDAVVTVGAMFVLSAALERTELRTAHQLPPDPPDAQGLAYP